MLFNRFRRDPVDRKRDNSTFDFAETTVIWEHRIWSRTGCEGQPWGVVLYGQYGTMIFNNGWRVIDGNTASDVAGEMDRAHLRNFIDCTRNGQRPNADIEEGHYSTRLCHLGNMAWRVHRTLKGRGRRLVRAVGQHDKRKPRRRGPFGRYI